MPPIYGGIEAGGTKFVCAVGTGPNDLGEPVRIDTTTPEETLARVAAYFRSQAERASLAAIGIASFGPVDLNPNSSTFGFITTTPKPGWGNTDLRGRIARDLGVPVDLDTDVNVAALGEQTWGAAQGLDDILYFTIGTGIGGGGIFNGRRLHGLVHPEMGHIRLPHDRQADPFPGTCPYHGDCWEGLASGPALEKRWGRRGETLPPDHPAWALEAHYLALAMANFIVTLSPRRIILGGGVMQQPQVLPRVRREVLSLLNGYVRAPEILDHLDEYLVLPGLGSRAGVLGAIALARESISQASHSPQ